MGLYRWSRHCKVVVIVEVTMSSPRDPLPFANPRHDPSRVIRAPRGSVITCKNWLIEAAYRMIQNNLDPDVAERPKDFVVYGGIGRAARDWACFDAILESLKKLESDETLLIQSGKPVGVFRTFEGAPRVLLAILISFRTGRRGTGYSWLALASIEGC